MALDGATIAEQFQAHAKFSHEDYDFSNQDDIVSAMQAVYRAAEKALGTRFVSITSFDVAPYG